MRIPRSFRPGAEAGLLRETSRAQAQQVNAEFASGRAASAAATAVAGTLGSIALAEQARFNDTLAAQAQANVATATTEANMGLAEIARERIVTPEDVEAARSAIAGSLSGMELVPPGAEDDLENYLQTYTAETLEQVGSWNYARSEREAIAATTQAIDSLIAAGDSSSAMALYDSTVKGQTDRYTPAQQQAIHDDIVVAKELGAVQAKLLEGDVDGAVEYMQNVPSRANISPQLANTMQGQMSAAISRYQAGVSAAEREAEQIDAAQGRAEAQNDVLSLQENPFSLTPEMITARYEAGAYGSDPSSAIDNVTSVYLQWRRGEDKRGELSAIATGAKLPDLANPIHKEAVDESYEQMVGMGMSPGQAAVSVASELRVAPPQFAYELGVRAGDQSTLGEAAQDFEEYQKANPGVPLVGLPQEALDRMETVNLLTDGGLPLGVAVNRVFDATVITPQIQEIRQANWTAFNADEDAVASALETGLERHFDSGWRTDEDIPPEMLAEIRTHAQALALTVASPEMAYSMAVARAANSGWQYTNLNAGTTDYDGEERDARYEKTRVPVGANEAYRDQLATDLGLAGTDADVAAKVEIRDPALPVTHPDYQAPMFELWVNDAPLIGEDGRIVLWTPAAPKSETREQAIQRMKDVQEYRDKVAREEALTRNRRARVRGVN